jgi:hypothetical protein
MNFLLSPNILIEAVAALVIFIVGYLVLMVSVIAGVAIVNLFYRGGRLLWCRVVSRAASNDRVSTEVAGGAYMASRVIAALSHPVAAVRRSSP